MRTRGSPSELERRRILAVERLLDGYSTQEVGDFLGIDSGTLRRWRGSYEKGGWSRLRARPVSGRPTKLTCTEEKIVRRWLKCPATELGFSTELWTAARLASVIEQEFGVEFHPKYLAAWLRDRGYSPQKPQRVAHEQDPQATARWLEKDWPRIKKKRADKTRLWP